MKGKFISIIFVFTLGMLIFMFYKSYNPIVMICDNKIEISKKYMDYLEKNDRIDSICFYSQKVLNSDFYYLEKLMYEDIEKEKDFFLDRAKIISKLINESDFDEFRMYFNSMSKKNKLEMTFILKLVNENNVHVSELLKE